MSEDLNKGKIAITNELNIIRAKIKEMSDEMKKTTLDKFKELSTTFIFDKYPEVKDFGWVQYTPYFNDGEECEFEIHSDYPIINGYNGNYMEYVAGYDEDNAIKIIQLSEKTIWDGGTKPNPDYNPYFEEIVEAIKDFINLLPEDDLRFIFGDHKEITITRNDLIVKPYDHE